jgi:ubiquinone/menaquinone biosynthesis C-methylase UbiE
MSTDTLVPEITGVRYKTINSEFKHWAPQYHKVITGLMKRYFDVWYDDLVAKMVETIATPNTKSVLEVGVGTALIASAIAQNLAGEETKVCGIDVTQEMLAKAKENVNRFGLDEKMELKYAPAEHIPYEDGTFDAVYSSLCFHHFKTHRALREKLRVLKTGGKLIILDLGALDVWRTFKGRLYYNFLARMRYLTTPSNRDEFFATFYTGKEWNKILSKYPLKNIQIQDISNCTGKITTERMMNLFRYKSMGTPPLWLITADYEG